MAFRCCSKLRRVLECGELIFLGEDVLPFGCKQVVLDDSAGGEPFLYFAIAARRVDGLAEMEAKALRIRAGAALRLRGSRFGHGIERYHPMLLERANSMNLHGHGV